MDLVNQRSRADNRSGQNAVFQRCRACHAVRLGSA
jgi:cytochrome c2